MPVRASDKVLLDCLMVRFCTPQRRNPVIKGSDLDAAIDLDAVIETDIFEAIPSSVGGKEVVLHLYEYFISFVSG